MEEGWFVFYRVGLLFLNFVAQIEKPRDFIGEAPNTSELLERIKEWEKRYPVIVPDAHRRVWYRGHSDHRYVLWPGVYRDSFTQSSKRNSWGKGIEEKRLNLERAMLDEFRTSGATLVNANAVVEVYFAAQHYGMPTRLLIGQLTLWPLCSSPSRVWTRARTANS